MKEIKFNVKCKELNGGTKIAKMTIDSDNDVSAVLSEETPVLSVDDITALTSNECDKLKTGDIVIKVDTTESYAYIVSYKKDETEINLTYTDSTKVETVSYIYNVDKWEYDTTDVTNL